MTTQNQEATRQRQNRKDFLYLPNYPWKVERNAGRSLPALKPVYLLPFHVLSEREKGEHRLWNYTHLGYPSCST